MDPDPYRRRVSFLDTFLSFVRVRAMLWKMSGGDFLKMECVLDFDEGGAMMVTALARFSVVAAARWSTDLVVKFTSRVLCTILTVDEKIGSFFLKELNYL